MTTVVGYNLPTGAIELIGGGSWSSVTNIESVGGGPASGYASNGETIKLAGTGFGFSSSVIPDAAYITKVELSVGWNINGTGGYVCASVGGNEAAHHACTRSVDGEDVFDITSDRGWTASNLRDGMLEAHIVLTSIVGGEAWFYCDYVRLRVTYSLANSSLAAAGLTVPPPVLDDVSLSPTSKSMLEMF